MSNSHVYRTKQEIAASENVAALFSSNPDSPATKLENFPKYVRRVPLKRFLALYEIFKRVLPVKGSIVELGVFRGFGQLGLAKRTEESGNRWEESLVYLRA